MEFFYDKNGAFKLITDAFSEGLVVVDTDQKIVAMNHAADKMFGYAHNELSGKPLNTLIPKRYHHNHVAHVKGFMHENDDRQMGQGRDLFGQRKDGSTFPVEAGLNPFKIKEKRYVMALVIDITVRKTQEHQIIELNANLEAKVKERTRALHQTVEELQDEIKLRKEAEAKTKEALEKERELGELKTKFLSLVSHEFKTPLSGILTSATLLGKYKSTEQQEKREKHIDTIKNEVKYLTGILNDFLSVERLEAGRVKYKLQEFPLSKVINEVIYNANMLLKEGQQIIYPQDIEGLSLRFDEKILELALSNLISNAIKYSSEGSTITIEVEQHHDHLIIHVHDQGIGIPKKEQKHLFDRYFRAENALLIQGTGIGLNIVQTHLKNLNGSIGFKSKEHQGSTFTMTIPQNADQL